MMKTLIYVPIIHSSADLGSLAKDVNARGIADLGEEFWQNHIKIVEGFWDALFDYFESLDVKGVRIYQDGMIANGEIGQKIVEEGVKLGSKNYELIFSLLKRGAILVKTEKFEFVKEERDRLLNITQAKSRLQKLQAFLKYKFVKDRLLNQRDKFIVQRINETLNVNETGILFIGAYHNIKPRLPREIQIKEIKEVEKMREYQQLLPFGDKIKYRKHFEELGQYLVSKVGV